MTEPRRRSVMALALVAAVALAACTSAAPRPSGTGNAQIPQPDVGDIAVADAADRVDLAMPTFTHPTQITNPLFPVAPDSAALLVGTVEGQAFRTEVTVLPTTRLMVWEGQQVETVVSQYVAFLDGRIHEVAYDLYAQADDGSVWYFGEDVFNFADGAIADTHGTWHAGIDGPAAMIMPADPAAGDVYRPENIPGLVFEEVVVQATDQSVHGPFGTVSGAIVVEEHHMDGSTEQKTFAPGYGEFFTDADGDVEALALAVPVDAGDGAAPAALDRLGDATSAAVDAAVADDADALATAAAEARAARAELGDDQVPAELRPLLDAAIAAVEDGDPVAALTLGRLAGDLRLRYEPVNRVDLSRIGLWGAQLVLDARAEDLDGVRADTFALRYTSERLAPGELPAELNATLEELQGAIDGEEFDAIADLGERVRELTGS